MSDFLPAENISDEVVKKVQFSNKETTKENTEIAVEDSDLGDLIVNKAKKEAPEVVEVAEVESDLGDLVIGEKSENMWGTPVEDVFADLGSETIKGTVDLSEVNTEGMIDAAIQIQKDKIQQEVEGAISATTSEAINSAVQTQQAHIEKEINTVITEEVDVRLNTYKKKRKRRRRREFIGNAVRWLCIIGLGIAIFSHDPTREQLIIIGTDIKELVVGLVNDEEVSSNKLALDILELLPEPIEQSILDYIQEGDEEK